MQTQLPSPLPGLGAEAHMKTRSLVARLPLLIVLLTGCSNDTAGPPEQPVPVPPHSVTIHGQIRLDSDGTTPVSGATVTIVEITEASTPNITLTSTATDGSGYYQVTFRATCTKMYGLEVGGSYFPIRSSNGGTMPLDSAFCAGDDWPLDLWVQH